MRIGRVLRSLWRAAGCLALACAIGLSASLATVAPAAAQETEPGFIDREYPLKAIFLYNFASYIKWPDAVFANSQSPFVIGILGSSPIDETLNQIAAQKKIDENAKSAKWIET
jgi:hypothetical protein